METTPRPSRPSVKLASGAGFSREYANGMTHAGKVRLLIGTDT
jgi:hypothetical protein